MEEFLVPDEIFDSDKSQPQMKFLITDEISSLRWYLLTLRVMLISEEITRFWWNFTTLMKTLNLMKFHDLDEILDLVEISLLKRTLSVLTQVLDYQTRNRIQFSVKGYSVKNFQN